MDIFIEQIITRKPDTRDTLLKIFLILSMISLGLLCLLAALVFWALPFISFVAMAAIFGIIWLGINLLKGLHLEYEYILTNKDLDIDKIKGKSKRKRMITLNLMNAEKFDLCDDSTSLEPDITVSAHDNSYINMWYLLINHDSHGRVVLLFNPTDDFIIKLNKSLPARVRKSLENMES